MGNQFEADTAILRLRQAYRDMRLSLGAANRIARKRGLFNGPIITARDTAFVALEKERLLLVEAASLALSWSIPEAVAWIAWRSLRHMPCDADAGLDDIVYAEIHERASKGIRNPGMEVRREVEHARAALWGALEAGQVTAVSDDVIAPKRWIGLENVWDRNAVRSFASKEIAFWRPVVTRKEVVTLWPAPPHALTLSERLAVARERRSAIAVPAPNEVARLGGAEGPQGLGPAVQMLVDAIWQKWREVPTGFPNRLARHDAIWDAAKERQPALKSSKRPSDDTFDRAEKAIRQHMA